MNFIIFLSLFFSNHSEREIVAKVNGVGIERKYLESQISFLENQLKLMGKNPKEIPKEVMEEEALNSLIEIELIYQDAKSKKISAKKEEIEKRLEDFKGSFKENSKYEEYLKKNDLSEKEVKKEIEREIVIDKYIDEELFKDLKPASEGDAKKFYEENPSYFIEPEKVRASHILISVPENATDKEKKEAKKKAESILKDLKKGENFEEVAKEKSDCPSKKNGGDLGYFTRGQMVKPFEDAAFSLETGQLSGIVETKFGYHIIKVLDHKKEGKIEFEKVKERIKSYLDGEKKKSIFKEKINELSSKAKIEKFLKKN